MRRIALVGVLLLAAPLPQQGQAARGEGGFADRSVAQEFKRLRAGVSPALESGNYQQAEQLARRMVELAAHGGARPQGLAAARYGWVLRQIGRPAEAESFLREAQPRLEDAFGAQSHAAIRNLLTMGRALADLGRLQEADSVLAEALRRQMLRDPGEADLAGAYTQLAHVRRSEGLRDEAEKLLRDAVAQQPAGRSQGGDKRLALAHLELAQLLSDLRKHGAAAAEAQRAYALFQQRLGARHPFTANAAGTLGLQKVLLKQYGEAEALLLAARAAMAEALGAASSRLSNIDRGLGLLYLRTERWPLAEKHLQNAIESARAADNLNSLARAARVYALALWQRERLEDALQQYLLALDAIDRGFARTQGLPETARNAFSAQYAPYYRETVRLLIELHRRRPQGGYDRQALEAVSRTQSRILSELLRRADVSRYGGDPVFVALRAQQLSLQRELEQLRTRRAELGDFERGADADESDDAADTPPPADPFIAQRTADARQRLAASYRSRSEALAAIEQTLRRDYPRYMDLTGPAPVSVDLLQSRLLQPGETLLSYYLLPRAVLLFEIRRGEFHLHVQPVESGEIGRLVARVRGAMEATANAIGSASSLAPADLARLYELLLAPVAGRIAPGGRVLVVGDGPLHTLPLEMLVTDWGESARKAYASARAAGNTTYGEYAALHYAASDFVFSYWPSLAALASARQFPKPQTAWRQQFVSFADPVFERTDAVAADTLPPALRSLRADSVAQIPPLPETADEARAIAGMVGKDSRLFLRERAQEYTLKHLDLSATRFVHFATHGLLAGDYLQLTEDAAVPAPGAEAITEGGDAAGAAATTAQPALLMALAGDMHGEDGLLTMGEVISGLDLNAELVALSACNTAGESSRGEGFAGMTRAFMYAGARGLLVSHWSVESLSTQMLMTETFRHLLAGGGGQDALAAARKSLWTSNFTLDGRVVSRAHPYFWASFVFVGD
ncbi:MAG: CHAT domain-containing protein [Rhodocyclaceae bacterium]|nr:CHAT domain-containing protein [Rhodocyclaceae bacterium]